ncbi:DHA2 family efflux MFS transporter permease subunit [Solihabitans fulvus]|uniref:DHA2 family efflux MFS transporter permease subunit n=1 Tax=Solihabitans fulvus TaxID=1892852 RepID=UPI001661ABFF|nr:DHA2 family efflux MFS transporter permease subunit [Solihabitans fulvus]
MLALTSGATFLAFLDTTVVNVAFPALRDSFSSASVSTLSWVVSAYAVLFAALLTPAGRLADVLGRKRLFLLGLLLFTVASLLSAISPNIEMLNIFRGLQGATAAAMIPSALGLVLFETPAEHRTAAIGVWGATASLAAVAGPTLGGVLVDVFSWRAIFLINLPLGLFLAFAGFRNLPKDRPTGHRLPDIIGTVAVTLGIGLVVAGLTEGYGWGWTNVKTIGALAVGLVLVLFGLFRSRTHPAPAVEISLWRNRTFAQANLTSLLSGIAMFGWLLSGPLFVSTVWHYSVIKSGVSVVPGAITGAVAAIIVGKRLSLAGQRASVSIGMILFGANGIWMYYAVGADPSFWSVWFPAGSIGGIGLGMTMTGLSSVAAVSVPQTRFATGIGLNLTARQLGGALGVAAVAVILSEKGLRGPQGFDDIFLFSGIAAGVAALAGLMLLRSRPATAPAGAATAAAGSEG